MRCCYPGDSKFECYFIRKKKRSIDLSHLVMIVGFCFVPVASFAGIVVAPMVTSLHTAAQPPLLYVHISMQFCHLGPFYPGFFFYCSIWLILNRPYGVRFYFWENLHFISFQTYHSLPPCFCQRRDWWMRRMLGIAIHPCLVSQLDTCRVI